MKSETAPWRRAMPPLAIVLLTMCTVGLDTVRVGFLADDFHFLDVSRRFGLSDLISGAHGLWPWYRPISRELFFKLVAGFGDQGLAVAHGMSLVVSAGIFWLLWRIGSRLMGAPAAATAVVLFATDDFTKLVSTWSSGFQDLFALFWMLVGLDAFQRGRRDLAAVAAFLAPLAKETGFVFVPLLAAYEGVLRRRLLPRPVLTGCGLATLLALVLHLLARQTWPAGAGWIDDTAPARSLAPALVEALRGFVSPAPSFSIDFVLVLRIAIAIAALRLLLRGESPGGDAPSPEGAVPPDRVAVMLVAGLLLCAMPTLVGHAARLTAARAYHLFPAAAFGALLIAWGIARAPRFVGRIGVPALLAWNIAGSAYAAPDMSRAASWVLGPIDWSWAVRLSAESESLGRDLRRELAFRPESLVVLYDSVPAGAYIQTEDGPATRVLLGDPTVRAYRLNQPPAELDPDRMEILSFDPDSLHLRKVEWSESETLLREIKAIIAGRGDVAIAITLYRARQIPFDFDRGYVLAAAELLRSGPERFLDDLRRAGLSDTTEATAARLSGAMSKLDRGVGAAMKRTLLEPRSAGAHAALADSLLARNGLPAAGMELRIATALDPRRYEDRLRLVQVMLQLGGDPEALVELDRLSVDPEAGAVAWQARDLAVRVRSFLQSNP